MNPIHSNLLDALPWHRTCVGLPLDITSRLEQVGLDVPDGERVCLPLGSDALEHVSELLSGCEQYGLAAALDCVMTQGAHREAFLGAVVLMRFGLLGAVPEADRAHENCAHTLARFGVESIEPAGLLAGSPISLAERFACLQAAGIALDAPFEAAPSLIVAAVQSRNLGSFNAMVEAGADIHLVEDQQSLAHIAAAAGAHDILAALDTLGVPLTTPDHSLLGYTPLHLAARRGHLRTVNALLAREGIAPDPRTRSGLTPLHQAASAGHRPVVRALLAAGADVNAAGAGATRPLHRAAIMGHVGLANRLLLAGADINAVADTLGTPLHAAVRAGDVATVSALLHHPGVKPNAADPEGYTALHHAAAAGFVEVVAVLLSTPRVDPNRRNARGQTALHLAAHRADVDTLRALLRTQQLNVNAADPARCTPLHIAVLADAPAAVRVLLDDARTLIDARTIGGFTPRSLALAAGSDDVLRELRAHPAFAPNPSQTTGSLGGAA